MNAQGTKLIKKINVKGNIKLLSGLHIGGTNAAVQIGGIDSPVIRNPINQQPYIPGSSLKGKMRCLLEQSEGIFGPEVGSNVKYGPADDVRYLIVRLFGTSKKENPRPSLLIFRDAYLLNADKLLNNRNTDLPYTEAKTEVVIDRIKGTATPRQIERVPAGVEFGFEIVFNVWGVDNDSTMFVKEEEGLKILARGMRLLEMDYLGGKGSRGSGQIKFILDKVTSFDLTNQREIENDYLVKYFENFK